MVHGGHLSIPVSQGFFQHLPQKDPIFSAEVLQRKRGDAAWHNSASNKINANKNNTVRKLPCLE